MYKPEDQAFLAEARTRIAAGVSKEEEKTIMQKVVVILREGRLAAVQSAKKARAKTAGPTGDALLAELEGL